MSEFAVRSLGVGVKVRRYFSWFNPEMERPVRTIVGMYEYAELKPTTNPSKCSYLKFSDCESVEPRHHYGVLAIQY